MAVTMKEIAQIAGVSTATVSKIINGADQHISEATRKKILHIIKETGYVPNAVAKGLRIKQTRTIGFILPDISNPFFPEIARGIESAAKKRGFGVVMCNTDDSASQELDRFHFLSSRMVDGIVFIRSLQQGNLDKFYRTGMPIVVVDRAIDTSQFGFGKIFIDTQKGTYESTNALLRAGCRNIAFVSARAAIERYQGYLDALSDAQIPVNDTLIYLDRYHSETGYNGIRHILQNHTVDGVVCGNDLIAVGVMKALHEAGIRIPRDIKVIGFDNIYFAQHTSPPLSTVFQPAYEMGVEAATMLINNILYDKPLYQKQLDFRILMRGTV